MDPTEKAGIRTGFIVLDSSHSAEKQNTQQRQEATTEKANKPNNKQNPPNAKQTCEKGPAKLKKSDGASQWSRQYGVKHQTRSATKKKQNNVCSGL